MGIFWQKGWLVNLHLKGNKFGSGILINDQGFILTAFHNVYGNTLGEHIIEKVTPSLNGTWHQEIFHISGKNNITVQCPDKSLARKIDLIAIKAEGTSFTRSPLQIATQLPEENQPVILLYYNLNHPKGNYWREESATVGPLFYEDGFCFFPLHKINGIDGASGGGVFTTDGKLLGIIKQKTDGTHDYIATFLGNIRLQHLIPQITNTQDSNPISNLLSTKRLQRTLKTPSPKPQKKIDVNIIADYDLEELTNIFYTNTSTKGLHSFAINGNGKKNILKNYIIERIKTVLESKTRRQCREPIHISLYSGDVNNLNNNLKTAFKKEIKQQSLAELINIPINILLVIWSHDIPTNNLRPTIKHFYEEIQSELSLFLNHYEYSFCFVIIWADLSPNQDLAPENNDVFSCLPLPNKFNVTDLKSWLHEILRNLNIEQETIHCHLNELERPQGYFESTYDALEKIFQNL